jgi:triosephosphate isomerase
VRPTVIAGNWKMHHGPAATREFFRDFSPELSDPPPTVVIFPPAISLSAADEARKGRPEVALGVQNIHWEASGAYTGEHSAGMAVAAGARFALIGHSERRHVFGETDEEVGRKITAALGAGLTPVVCVGETLEERQAGRVEEVILRQLDAALQALPEGAPRFFLAYEPVWAIGTGETATPDDAASAHGTLRARLDQALGPERAAEVPILYGGSVKPSNVAELLSASDVDGVLVGGASLDAPSFAAIAEAG